MAIAEGEGARHTLTFTKSVDALDDFVGHRERRPAISGDDFATRKVEKIMCALWISSRTKANAAVGSFNHSIRVFNMTLSILAKRNAYMMCIREFVPTKEITW